MLKKILIVVVLAVAGLAVFIGSKPDHFSVSRAAVVQAPPEVVFAQVNDFHKWQAWSPWAKLDPNAKNTFEGAASGEGAVFRWAGDKNVGEGSMTLIESRPNERIRIKLEFLKPFKAENMTEFTFGAQGGVTVVTWTMSGKANFISKAISLVFDCDKMVGEQFEKGLASLNSVVK